MDVAGEFSTSTLECVKENDLTFVRTSGTHWVLLAALAGFGFAQISVRSWHSYGGFDSAGPITIRNAHAAGFKYVDTYLFPCPAKSASAQVQGTLSGLSQGGAHFGTLWLDIETNPSPGCAWSGDHSANCEFIKDLIRAGHAAGRVVGVYSSVYARRPTAGAACNVGGEFPDVAVWYAHYDVSGISGNCAVLDPHPRRVLCRVKRALGIGRTSVVGRGPR